MNSIYLRDVTCLDFAHVGWYTDYLIQGRSLMLSFLVSGDLLDTEEVVIDFSTVKGELKKIIDHKETGLDHKLWVNVNDGWGLSTSEDPKYAGNVLLETPNTGINVPRNALFVHDSLDNLLDLEVIRAVIDAHIEKQLGLISSVSLKVKTFLTEDHISLFSKRDNQFKFTFNYSHGLPFSSSWACQNPAHGHTSVLEVVGVEDTQQDLRNIGFDIGSMEYTRSLRDDNVQVLKDMKTDLNHAVFLSKRFCLFTTDNITVSYTTDRGSFSIRYCRKKYNLHFLPGQTTVENLLDYIVARFKLNTFTQEGAIKVLLSEGLQKGAYKEISCKSSLT